VTDPTSAGYVMATDRRWFEHLKAVAGSGEALDNVNFWRPSAQDRFRAVPRGGSVFFRLKSPVNAIVGFGTFVADVRERIGVAWELFGEKNGYPDLRAFTEAIVDYRRKGGYTEAEALARPLTCLVLVDAVTLPEDRWLPWDDRSGWSPNIVSGKGYDLRTGPGQTLAALRTEWLAALRGHMVGEAAAPPLGDGFVPLMVDERTRVIATARDRVGQGAFKAELLAAYDGCAVTGEHSRPVLDAAHIQPYLGPRSNHPQNGLLLRADLHRLFDAGYVTVTPELRLEVSGRLREEFDNGKVYYDLQGRPIRVPADPSLTPSRAALAWHNENVFR